MILQGLQIRAAFYFATAPAAGRWVWVEWFATGSKHAAIIAKARELDADAWDLGQAEATPATRSASRGHTPTRGFARVAT